MPRKKKVAKSDLPQISELVEIMHKLVKRIERLEKADRVARPIGFYTDCQSNQESHPYIEDESEVPEFAQNQNKE
jgi:hypothetical protein